MNDEQKRLREDRIKSIEAFIVKHVGRTVSDGEVASLRRLSEQTLHLLSAAIDEA